MFRVIVLGGLGLAGGAGSGAVLVGCATPPREGPLLLDGVGVADAVDAAQVDTGATDAAVTDVGVIDEFPREGPVLLDP